ncbi:hypothetical protein [Heliorestis convoluta]|uniref:Uncharacterized protein n=1 Tax=Heliorestis convoluta TaxID=356322 RepID=A0A5Q2MXG1_9FIRM|nr:hypothetical protein [Heliorestis convoluta]QGG47288.1 hypothetical protein FTV88_1141 [Heliorestis convoluta]
MPTRPRQIALIATTALIIITITTTVTLYFSMSDNARTSLLRGDPTQAMIERWLTQGELSEEELAYLLGLDSSDPNNPSSSPNNESPINIITLNPLNAEGHSPIEADIRQRYNEELQNLQIQNEAKLNNMLQSAQQEYIEAKNTGSTTRIAAIATKYYRQAKTLQSQTDQEFEKIVQNLEQELRTNHLPPDLVHQVRAYYKQQVQEKQKEILQRALSNS